MNSRVIALIIVIIGVIGAFFILGSGSNSSPQDSGSAVEIVDGIQYINITAKGGYSPRIVNAQAGIPSVLRMKTQGTFDCSLSLVVPDLGVRQILPKTGVTEFRIPAKESGQTLQGLCGMGMYNFQIKFN